MILDSSAVLALLLDEPSELDLNEIVPEGMIGSVNYAEVASKLSWRGLRAADVQRLLDRLHLDVRPLTPHVAFLAGVMLPDTQRMGLSLGDRCCLALAHSLAMPVLTGDKRWKQIETVVGVEIRLFR